MKPNYNIPNLLTLTGSALLAISSASAAPGTWNANSNGDWSTASNWDSSIVADGTGSLATLGDFIDADRIINLDIAAMIGGITAADTTHNYTISGASTLTLDSTGSSIVNVTTAGRTLTIASVLNGNDGITKSGAGTLALSNANLISGTFALTAGTLQLGHATSMGTSALTMTSGTTLQLRNDADTIFTAPINTAPTTGVTYNIDVNQATVAGTNRKLSLGNITFATSSSGSITNTINVTGGNGYILGLGTITAPSGSAGHSVVINATTAAVEIAKFASGGWGYGLQLQGGNSITLGNFELNSNGSNSLTVSGSGTVVTLGTTTATNNRTGATIAYTLNSGTLNLTTTTSLANVYISGTAAAPTFAINGGTLNNTSGSALTLAANSGTTAGRPTITIGGNFSFGTALSTSANNLNLGNGAVSITGNRTITLNGTGTTLTMGGMSNTSGANQTTTVNGAGNTLVLGGYSPGNGFTGVIDGNANVNITGAISSTGNFTYSGSAKLTITGASTNTGFTTVNSGVLAIVNGGSLYSNLNNNKANAITINSGSTVEFDSWTYGSGCFGSLWHPAANTVVNGGTLRYVGMGSNTGARSFTIGANGATLESATSGASLTITYSDAASLTSSLGGLLTLTGAGDGRIDLTIPGSGGLTKSGTGTWTLTGTGSGSGSNTYSGNTNINQGVLNTTKALALPGYNTSGKVVVNGGTLGVRVGGSGWTTTEINTLLTNATKTSGALGIDTTNGNLTQWTAFTTTNLGATLGLTKLGANTLTLDQTNNYTGATTVSSGTLVVNGSISNSSLTTVASGATIAGSGTIGALTVSSGGFINPGNSPGTLDTGNYSQAGLYTAEITGLTPDTQHDQINVTGTVNITSGSLTALFSAGSYTANDLIFILLNDGTDSITGNYNGLAQGATVTSYGGFDWQISYTANNTGIGTGTFTGGNDIALIAVIPEPSVALLGAIGLMLLFRRRR